MLCSCIRTRLRNLCCRMPLPIIFSDFPVNVLPNLVAIKTKLVDANCLEVSNVCGHYECLAYMMQVMQTKTNILNVLSASLHFAGKLRLVSYVMPCRTVPCPAVAALCGATLVISEFHSLCGSIRQRKAIKSNSNDQEQEKRSLDVWKLPHKRTDLA